MADFPFCGIRSRWRCRSVTKSAHARALEARTSRYALVRHGIHFVQRLPAERRRCAVSPAAVVGKTRRVRFLEGLRPHTVIAEPVSVSEDFTNLAGLPRVEQEKRLKALDARGETVTAIYMARRLFGSSLAEATKLVESLRVDPAAPT